MRKRMIKKLYTYYTVKGKCDEIRNNPEHNFVSYSCGVAECIKYHDSFTTWLEEIGANKFKIGFGVKVFTEDGKDVVNIHRYDLNCSTWMCNNKPIDDVVIIMANVINYYLNDDIYYYEIEDDGIYVCAELTGHMYYRSPYESCDGCGNCDGARCDICSKRYIVKDLYTDIVYYTGFDKEEAERVKNEHAVNYSNIIDDILINYKIDMEWFENEINGGSDIRSLFKIINKYNIPYV